MSAQRDDVAALSLLIRGFQVSRMIRLAADLRLADHLMTDSEAGGGTTAVALASVTGVMAEPLLRMCRALAAVGIFTVDADGMIGHSPTSLLLRRDARPGLYHAARFFPAHFDWLAWDALDVAVRDGAVPFEAVWNSSRFEYLRANAAHGRLFDAVMAASPDDRFGAIAAAYDFSDAAVIADIGGGNGALLRAILARHVKPRGVLYDWGDVLEPVGESDRLSGRITLETGDFFEDVPQGADIYLLSWILHDWDDEACLRILRNCQAAMRPGARLLVIERVVEADPRHGNALDYLTDMQMMVVLGGRERTLPQFQVLLRNSGLGLGRLIRTASTACIIECNLA